MENIIILELVCIYLNGLMDTKIQILVYSKMIFMNNK